MSAPIEEPDGGDVDAPVSEVTGVHLLSPEALLRKHRVGRRKHTESMRWISRHDLALGAEEFPDEGVERPRTRGECVDAERPCPFLACRYHIALDVHPVRGAITTNFPDIPVEAMVDSCALDVADRGPHTLEEVGELMNLTRERVRQIETAALRKLERRAGMFRLDRGTLR